MLKIALVSLCLLTLVGCSAHSDSSATATADMCSHCSGTQMMTAKGTCEACGMTVDACTACPGEQTVTADGKCSACGGKVAVKS